MFSWPDGIGGQERWRVRIEEGLKMKAMQLTNSEFQNLQCVENVLCYS
jgi:hypothetical protein